MDGTQLNGTIEVYGSIKDLSLDSWALAVVREDGTADIISEGTAERGGELLGTFSCREYADGETITLLLVGLDKAGNIAEYEVGVIVNKRAIPLNADLQITAPASGTTITAPCIKGEYSPAESGLLYIDGAYAGEVSGGEFCFDAITYEENSRHTLSIIRTESGMPQYSQGLAKMVLSAESFEDGKSTFRSETTEITVPVMGLLFSAAGDKSISYSYSADGGVTWNAVADGEYIPLRETITSITVKAEGIRDTASGYTMNGIVEMSPVTVKSTLLRDTESFSPVQGAISAAFTELYTSTAGKKHQFIDGELADGTFTLNALKLADNRAYNTVLIGIDSDGKLSGSEITPQILERVNLSGDTWESERIETADSLYAVRAEILPADSRVWYSLNGSDWTELTPGEYTVFEKASNGVFFRAEGSGLKAIHMEGVTSGGVTVMPKLVCSPVGFAVRDYSTYYENERLWRNDLTWEDPTQQDNTAANTIHYEIYRNGALPRAAPASPLSRTARAATSAGIRMISRSPPRAESTASQTPTAISPYSPPAVF